MSVSTHGSGEPALRTHPPWHAQTGDGETRGPAGVRGRGFSGPTLRGSQGDPGQGVWLAGHGAPLELKVGGPAICIFIFNEYWWVAYWLGTILIPVRQKRSLL